MLVNLMKSKIHRAVVTEANLHYIGSITVDEHLMRAADLVDNEKVQVVDVNNGNRFETYVIHGPENSGMICINGAAARLVQPGDTVIIIAYGLLDRREAAGFKPRIVFVNSKNMITGIMDGEIHGEA